MKYGSILERVLERTPYAAKDSNIIDATIFFTIVVLFCAVAITTFLPALKSFFFKTFPVIPGGAILITGTSTGIGRDSSIALANQGYIVYCTVRREEDFKSLESLDIKNLRPVYMDVTNQGQVNEVYEKIRHNMENEGFLFAGIVNNAGIMVQAPMEYHKLDDIKGMFETNVFGAIRVTQKFLPMIKKDKGRIVTISSAAGRVSQAKLGTYSATKHAMEAFFTALRLEVKPLGVAVILVEPGFIDTPLINKVLKSDEEGKGYPKAIEHYPWLYRKWWDVKFKYTTMLASNVKTVVSAVQDAFQNPWPNSRYKPGNVGGLPTPLVIFLATSVPEWVYELFAK